MVPLSLHPAGLGGVSARGFWLAPQRKSELREFLPALGAGVVENPVHLVDVGLGLVAVGADTAVDESFVWHRGHPTLQNRSRNPLKPLATPLA